MADVASLSEKAMFRKVLLAAAAVLVLGSSALVPTEASARHRHHGWGHHHGVHHHHHWRHHRHWRRHWGWRHHHVRCWRWVLTPYGHRRVWVCG
jgi:hypothetical protein